MMGYIHKEHFLKIQPISNAYWGINSPNIQENKNILNSKDEKEIL